VLRRAEQRRGCASKQRNGRRSVQHTPVGEPRGGWPVSPVRTLFTFLLFASTLVAIVLRPRGIAAGWWTCGAAAITLAAGLVHPGEVWALVLVAKEALLFLLGLLALSALLEASGFFEWAAVLAARSARSGAGLLANVLVLGALITFVLSLDTTAVILTRWWWPRCSGSRSGRGPTSCSACSCPAWRHCCFR
jgi:arsenical pump membrane protein